MQLFFKLNSYITNIWGNKITLFLFLLNLITNATILSSYKSARDVLYWIAISALFSTIEAAFFHCFKRINMQKLFLIIVVFFHVFLSIVDIFLLYNFQQIFNQDTVDIIAQTNPTEAKSFLSTYLSSQFVIYTLLSISCILWILRKIAIKLGQRKAIAFCLFVLTLIGASVYVITIKNFILYKNGQAVPQLHAFTRSAYSSLVLFDRHKQIVALQDINSKITCSKPTNYINKIIIVIGESFTPYHSSLYGYNKETNPLLHKRVNDGSLTVFTDVVTYSDHTEGVMCSVFPLNEHPEVYFTDPLFPVCFKKAGYNTMMLDNQYFVGHGITFLTDEKLSSLMFDFRNTKHYRYDGDMLKDLRFTDAPQLFVIHLQGQHYTYSDRYPDNFSHFKPSDYSNLTESQKELVAHYDNATLYNDFIISQIISYVEKQDCLLVYFSDHGEELFEVDDYIGHGNAAIRPDPTYQIKVPLVIWTSETFCSKHSDIAKRIKESADKPIITSDLAHFLIDAAGFETKQFNPKQSFINKNYSNKNRVILNTVNYEDIKTNKRVKSRYY